MLRRIVVSAVIGAVLTLAIGVADFAPSATPAAAQAGYALARYLDANDYQTAWVTGLLGGGGAYAGAIAGAKLGAKIGALGGGLAGAIIGGGVGTL